MFQYLLAVNPISLRQSRRTIRKKMKTLIVNLRSLSKLTSIKVVKICLKLTLTIQYCLQKPNPHTTRLEQK